MRELRGRFVYKFSIVDIVLVLCIRLLILRGCYFPYARKVTKGAHKRNLTVFSYVSFPFYGCSSVMNVALYTFA